MALWNLIPWTRERRELPIRHEEANPFRALWDRMDRLFEDLASGFDMMGFWDRPRARGAFVPSISVAENDDTVTVSAELPGMDDKDVEVTLTRDTLTIKGEKKVEHEDKGHRHYRYERSYGSFERHIPLPAEVETDNAKAVFSKGVLTVTLPKTPEARSSRKRIPIKTEG